MNEKHLGMLESLKKEILLVEEQQVLKGRLKQKKFAFSSSKLPYNLISYLIFQPKLNKYYCMEISLQGQLDLDGVRS